MTAEQVARPVYAFDAPASMAQRVKVARAIKVLHGPDCREYLIGPKYVVYSAGELCPCAACEDYLRKLAGLDWVDLPGMMIVCPTCGNKRCPHATDHEEDCTRSNKPGQPGSAYFATPHDEPDPKIIAPPDSVRAYLATLPKHPDTERPTT